MPNGIFDVSLTKRTHHADEMRFRFFRIGGGEFLLNFVKPPGGDKTRRVTLRVMLSETSLAHLRYRQDNNQHQQRAGHIIGRFRYKDLKT